jgi:putative membrane protein
MMFGYDGPLGAWGWFGMTVGMVAFWALLFAAIYWLVRSTSDKDRASTPSRATPEQLLAERFAQGEIDREEYESRLDALRGRVRS